jgi:hypothetical protein
LTQKQIKRIIVFFSYKERERERKGGEEKVLLATIRPLSYLAPLQIEEKMVEHPRRQWKTRFDYQVASDASSERRECHPRVAYTIHVLEIFPI